MTKAELRKELRRTRKVRDAWCREYARVRDGLAALVMKLDEIHADPTYKSVWTLAQLHGGRYRGPNYVAELASARGAVKGFLDDGRQRPLQ